MLCIRFCFNAEPFFSLDDATSVVAASTAFLSCAIALESMILVLPLYHRFEFLDDSVPPFQPTLSNRILLDTVKHLPTGLSVLELRFMTYCADMDDELDNDLEHRLRFDWITVAQNVNSHGGLRSIVIVLQGIFCKRKQPLWTPVLINRLTPNFSNFNIHYCEFYSATC